MAQSKKNIARWVLQGICVLGIFSGFGCVMAGVAMLLALPTVDDIFGLCLLLGFSAVILVLGVWLARDCYRMLRGRSFEAVKSIAAILALVLLGVFEPWLMGPGAVFDVNNRRVWNRLGPAIVLSFYLVYFICQKLLTRLVKAARGPEEPSETSPPAG